MTSVDLSWRDSPVPAYVWRDRRDRWWYQGGTMPLSARVVRSRWVSAPRTAAYGFPVLASAPRRARRHTVEFARRWGFEAVVEPAELLVSELMTNALEASRSGAGLRRHNPALAAAPLQLRLAVEHGRLRIEVRDDNPRPPVPDDPAPYEERGRGLLLVEAYSHRWGYHRLPSGGKAVWCVVAPPSDDPTR